jgi:hypothetical protein
MHFHCKLGAKTLKEVVFEHKDKKYPLFFFEIDLQCPTFLEFEANLPNLIKEEQAEFEAKAK